LLNACYRQGEEVLGCSFLVSGLKDEKLIEKQTYIKNETLCKLCSRVFF